MNKKIEERKEWLEYLLNDLAEDILDRLLDGAMNLHLDDRLEILAEATWVKKVHKFSHGNKYGDTH